MARYIVLNPVRAHMVRSARDWPWSNYRATASQASAPARLHTDWLLAAFGNRKRQAIVAYKQSISEGKGQPSLWQSLQNQVYLGSEAFIDKIQQHIDLHRKLDEIPSSQRRPVAKPLEEYQNSYKDRNTTIVAAYQSGGYTLKDIGQHFGLHYSTVSGITLIIKNQMPDPDSHSLPVLTVRGEQSYSSDTVRNADPNWSRTLPGSQIYKARWVNIPFRPDG